MTDSPEDKKGAAPAEPHDENKLIAERRAKLAAIRARGQAYPNDFRRDALAGELHHGYDDKDDAWLEANPTRVHVGGRMMFKRVMGKASFAKIADRTGQIQLFIQRENVGDAVYDAFKSWDVGDILGAEGVLFRTKTGELSVRVERIRLITKSLRPLPDKWHGLTDTETRYRQRYVDLIVNERSREVFKTRTRIIRYLRDYLDALGFLEVETPMMQPIPGGAAAKPFVTHHNALDLDMYLRIAPELYLKRLVVGGFDRVYEINRNFRNEGLSTQHNPEFTMLELYLAWGDYKDLMDWIEKALRGLAEAVVGTTKITYQGREYDLAKPFKRVTVEQAILEKNPDLDPRLLRDPTYLRGVCERLGIVLGKHDGPGKMQIEIFEKTVEPHLLDPTFVYGYPTEVSPLSRANDADPFITDRFEFFVAGRELANGFSELNDPEDQAARFRAQVERKEGGDEEAMFYDADYVRALEYGMPPTAGLGVGIDRLTMFLTDSPSIRDVILFPHMRPEAD
ncbi:MAG TPA: lysine--tRNA ligase [Steroidobacteraceae bacterium]|jgi:lysyl-tRNA synthetase class 2|nr:lysine--tRNA ligase [Steroidobacteraceae bacterium]